MAFTPLKKEEGKEVFLLTTSATSYTKGNGIKYSSGYVVEAASGDASIDYVALETKTSATGNGLDTLKCIKVDPSIRFKVTLSTTFIQASHAGNRYDISAAGTIDLAATTDKAFLLELGSGTTGEGYFQQAIA